MKTLYEKLTILLLFVFISCSTGYEKSSSEVYYKHWNEGSGQHKRNIDADPLTFKVLEFESYAKDNKTVFYKGEKIIGADASTFVALGEFYAKDKNFGWYGKDTIRTSRGEAFTIINDYYSTDGFDVFYTTKPLNMTKPSSFMFVYGEEHYESWTTDGEHYFFNNYKIPSDDYENVVLFLESGGLSKDNNWIYFLDHKLNYDINGTKVIDTIHIASFEVTGYIKCRDKFGCINVYHGRKMCE